MIYDYENLEKCKKVMKDNWINFRNELGSGGYSYENFDKAWDTLFMKTLKEFFNNDRAGKYFTKRLMDLYSDKIEFVRGAKIKDVSELNYERFIPKSEYITRDNRFSPKGLEWLYLSFGDINNDDKDYSIADNTVIKECRAKEGDRFGICNFRMIDKYKKNKIIDLNVACDKAYEDINYILNEIFFICVEQSSSMHQKKNEEKKVETIAKWISYTYVKLFAEELFEPIKTDDKEFQYAPFQCIAKYFKSLGFCGIIYPSTVFSKGKNIVLFDKNIFEPYGTIRDITI